MFAVEIYAAVRRFVFVEGKSRREAARVFGLSRDTIAKMCRYSAPPGYVRSKAPGRPKLGPLVPVIDAILEFDKTAPPKQRHTAKRIFERLRNPGHLRRGRRPRLALRPCRKVAWFCYAPLADFYSAVDRMGLHRCEGADGGCQTPRNGTCRRGSDVVVVRPGVIKGEQCGRMASTLAQRLNDQGVHAGRISGAGLCARISNFHFGGAETGSTVDRDRFAECSLGATPT